jgi:predicted DNA-binding transcriptional regulator YafY
VVSYPGQGGGLGILEGYKLDKSFFSIDELQTILVGLNALDSINEKKDISTLVAKISEKDNQTIVENADMIIDLSSWFSDNAFQNYINQFRKAIKALRLVTIEYQSNMGYSKRIIEPYKLVFKHSSWYLYAFCLERQQFRLFKLNRILSYTISEKTFTTRPYQLEDLSLFFQNNHYKESTEHQLIEIILKYSKNNESFLMDKMGVQKFHFNLPTHTITFKTSDINWAIDFIMSLKDMVKVIEPDFLVKDISDTIKNMNRLYES